MASLSYISVFYPVAARQGYRLSIGSARGFDDTAGAFNKAGAIEIAATATNLVEVDLRPGYRFWDLSEALREEASMVFQEVMEIYVFQNQIQPQNLIFGVPGGLRFPSTIQFLQSPCCCNLKHLKLEITKLTTLCANRLVEGLHRMSSVTSLDLEIVSHQAQCGLEGIPIFIKYLEQESRLEKLSLAHYPWKPMENPTCFTGHAHASNLFSVLARRLELVELSLTFTFDLADWKSIESYLIQNQSLQKLRLDSNVLDCSPNLEVYSQYLEEGLRQNKSIRSLELIASEDDNTPQALSEIIYANADRPFLNQLKHFHIFSPDNASLRALGSCLERSDCGLASLTVHEYQFEPEFIIKYLLHALQHNTSMRKRTLKSWAFYLRMESNLALAVLDNAPNLVELHLELKCD